MADSSGLPLDVIATAVAHEVKAVRERVGMSRKDVASHLQGAVSERTYGNWEQGTRKLSVPRIVDVCAALGVSAAPVLDLAIKRAELISKTLVIDIGAMARDEMWLPTPLRAWAQGRSAGGPLVTSLDQRTVRDLAWACGLTPGQLCALLLLFETCP